MWEALSSGVAVAKVHSAHHQQLALASVKDGGANNILAPLSPLLPYIHNWLKNSVQVKRCFFFFFAHILLPNGWRGRVVLPLKGG